MHTIRWRIALSYIILLLITLAGVGIYLAERLNRSYRESLEQGLADKAFLIADTYQLATQSQPNAAQINLLVREWSVQTGTRITVIAEDGRVIADSFADYNEMENHSDRPEVIQAITSGRGASSRFSVTQKIQMIYAAVSVQNGAGEKTVVRVAQPASEAELGLQGLRTSLAVPLMVAFTLAAILAVIIAGYCTAPVRRLADAAARLARDESIEPQLVHRNALVAPAEISQIHLALHQLASKLGAQNSMLNIERAKAAVLLQKMTDGAVIVDQDGLILTMNAAAATMFSIQPDKASHKSIAEVLRHHQVVELWQHCHQTGKSSDTIIELSTNKQYLQALAVSLDDYMPGSVLLLFQNLTHQRYLETVRRDFVSNISHELRTPLASLKALTETLQSGAMDDPPAAQRFLQRMETEVDALIQMVAELLELSRIESGRVPLQFQAVAPAVIVNSAVERLRLQAERARISLQVQCPPDLPMIRADQTRLEQVMVNLLHNAIKFTDPGGSITVRASRESYSGENEPDVCFSVSDTGIGISADELPRIFERFYKTDRARTSGGTGLGLAIARHMVDAHQGRIWAESIQGHGSTFYFTIPAIIPA